MATTITRDGITWTLAGDHTHGVYPNGDPWVVGPVSVTAISPATRALTGGRVVHGSMKNYTPVSLYNGTTVLGDDYAQGFDSLPPAHTQYDEDLNVALDLPLALVAGDSLLSVESDTATTGVWFSCVNRAAVLTVVTAAPAADEFRPPYWYPDRPAAAAYRWNDGMLAHLPSVFPASFGASISDMATRLKSLWMQVGSAEGHWRLMPNLQCAPYYVGRSNELGEMFMALCSQIPVAQKRELAIAMVQYGIDIAWSVKNGFYCGTTHSTGKKAPVVFAALLLGHADLIDVNGLCRDDLQTPIEGKDREHRAVWGEDGQTFVVEETSPGVINFGQGGYTAAHVGLVDWGNFHWLNDGASDLADWNGPGYGNQYRQCCAASCWVSTYLSMMALGAQKLWGWSPYFDWVYRWITTAPTLGLSLQGMPAHVGAIFNSHKPNVRVGMRQIGLSVPGMPLMTMDTTPDTKRPWRLRIQLPVQLQAPGLLVRSEETATRPRGSYFGAPTKGHVYVDEATYYGSGFFNTDSNGVATIEMAAIDDVGETYTVQAGILINGEFHCTNALEVTVQEA